MIILLDEQLDTPDSAVAKALNAFGPRHGCTFRSLRSESPGLVDPDIPVYCRRNGISVLVTANVKDFGARKVLYEALLMERISVVVLRPGGRLKLTPENQTAMLLPHAARIAKLVGLAVDTDRPVLLKLTPTELTERTLDDLTSETGTRSLP